MSASDANALAADVAGASISAFAGSGHLINVEEPERFVAEVRTFLLRS